MRILMIHNHYRFAGGEDAVAQDEVAMLRAQGHEVLLLEKSNTDISAETPPWQLGLQAVWSQPSFKEVQSLCQRFKPDVIHAHNTFPLVSPSAYWAAVGEGIPVIQTLHNFRLLCANAMLLREGKPCEDCVGKLPWRGVLRKCYRDSYAQSLSLVAMLGVNRCLGTYQQKVRRYIALNQYCREKFVAGGLPAGRIAVKPNFTEDPGGEIQAGHGLLFVGRLSEEKGLAVLIEAAALAQQPITVVGDGPLASVARQSPWLKVLGHCSRAKVLALMSEARALVVPSLWYENMPRTVIEAYACGLPVLASDIGALKEMVHEGCTGWRVDAGDARALAQGLNAVGALKDDEILAYKQRARTEYLSRYTPEQNYRMLLSIYTDAMAEEAGVRSRAQLD